MKLKKQTGKGFKKKKVGKTKKEKKLKVKKMRNSPKKYNTALPKITSIFSDRQRGSGEATSRPRQRTTIFDM